MLKLKKVTSLFGTKVYTDGGEYFGDVEEVILEENRISSWKIKSTKESSLQRTLGGARGVLIPHQLVRAIGEIVIVSSAATPSYSSGSDEEQ